MPPQNNNAILHLELIAKDFARLYDSLSFPIRSQSQFEEAWDTCNMEYIHYAGSTPMVPFIDSHIREVFTIAAAYLSFTTELAPYAIEFGIFLVSYLFFTQPGLPLIAEYNTERGSNNSDGDHEREEDNDSVVTEGIVDSKTRRTINQRRRREEQRRKRYMEEIGLLKETEEILSTRVGEPYISSISLSQGVVGDADSNPSNAQNTVRSICHRCTDIFRINVSLDCYSLLLRHVDMMDTNTNTNTVSSSYHLSQSQSSEALLLTYGVMLPNSNTDDNISPMTNTNILADIIAALDDHMAWNIVPAVDNTVPIGCIIKTHLSLTSACQNTNGVISVEGNNNNSALFDIPALKNDVLLENRNFSNICKRRRLIQQYLLLEREMKQSRGLDENDSSSVDDVYGENQNNNNNNNQKGTKDILPLQRLLSLYDVGSSDAREHTNAYTTSLHLTDEEGSNITEMANKYFQATKGFIR